MLSTFKPQAASVASKLSRLNTASVAARKTLTR
jgi:hypothetical protein